MLKYDKSYFRFPSKYDISYFKHRSFFWSMIYHTSDHTSDVKRIGLLTPSQVLWFHRRIPAVQTTNYLSFLKSNMPFSWRVNLWSWTNVIRYYKATQSLSFLLYCWQQGGRRYRQQLLLLWLMAGCCWWNCPPWARKFVVNVNKKSV